MSSEVSDISAPLNDYRCFFCGKNIGYDNQRTLGSTLSQRFPSRPPSSTLICRSGCDRTIQRKIGWIPDLEKNPAECFARLGWVLIRAEDCIDNEALLGLADSAHNKVKNQTSESRALSAPQTITGQVQQRRLDRLRAYKPLGLMMKDVCLSHLKSVMDDNEGLVDVETPAADVLKELKVADLSFLESAPGDPPQQIHRDGFNSSQFGAILFLGNTVSTDLPIATYQPYSKTVETVPESKMEKLAEHHRSQLSSSTLKRDCCFVNFPVHRGDLLLFREDIFHRGPGVALDATENRVVLFLKLAHEVEEIPEQQSSVHEMIDRYGRQDIRVQTAMIKGAGDHLIEQIRQDEEALKKAAEEK